MDIIHKDYSSLGEDTGYRLLRTNSTIDQIFPYVDDIDPRLVQFMRTAYSHRIHGIVPCVPLDMEYHITRKDVPYMKHYLRKYGHIKG